MFDSTILGVGSLLFRHSIQIETPLCGAYMICFKVPEWKDLKMLAQCVWTPKTDLLRNDDSSLLLSTGNPGNHSWMQLNNNSSSIK